MAGRVRRWAWPAAFSTMTAVAVMLLAMLVVPSEKKTTNGRQAEVWSAGGNVPQPAPVSNANEMPYSALRDQVLRDGVDSWKPPESSVVTTASPMEAPLSYREQLDRLLKQEDLRGS